MLFANRPNPFNPETIIRYSIENDDRVNLIVYDILGREVAVLVDEFKEAGEYEVSFIPKGLPSGVYLYRIKTSRFQDVKKMMYLKQIIIELQYFEGCFNSQEAIKRVKEAIK